MRHTPIRTEADYQSALKQLELLWGFEPETQEEDDFEVLSILIEAYEQEHYPIPSPTPVEAVLFAMDQRGLEQSALGKIMGSASRASEFLNGKRSLSINHIRALHKSLGIPTDILIQA